MATKVLSPKSRFVKPGGKITFSAVLRNQGSADAVHVELCESIPKGMKFVSAPGREIFKAQRQVCWTTSRMAPGTAWTSTLVLKANKKAVGGKKKNVVRASARNVPAVTKSSTFFVGKPTKLSLSAKIVSPTTGRVQRGQRMRLSTVVRNVGSGSAVDVQLCEAIPHGMKYVSAPGRPIFLAKRKHHKLRVCWVHGRMAPGKVWRSTLVLKTKKHADYGTRYNVYRALARNASTVKKSSTFRILPKGQKP